MEAGTSQWYSSCWKYAGPSYPSDQRTSTAFPSSCSKGISAPSYAQKSWLQNSIRRPQTFRCFTDGNLNYLQTQSYEPVLCTDTHVCAVYMYVYPRVTASSQCWASSSIIFHFFFFSHSISLNLEFVDSARSVRQKAPGMFLSLLPPVAGITRTC